MSDFQKDIQKVAFDNQVRPESSFDLLLLEELMTRSVDHDIDKPHKVEFFMLILISEGRGAHNIDFIDYPYEAGSVLTIRKDQIQYFTRSSAKGYIMLFMDEFLTSYLDEAETRKTVNLFNELLGAPCIRVDEDAFKELLDITKRIQHEYQENDDEYALGVIRSELHILTTKLFRVKQGSQQMVGDKKYLSQFIEFQNLVEQQVAQSTRVGHFARQMGVSTKTLNTITRSIVHKSAKDFIDEICIKQIKRYLIHSSESIKEVAFSMGFYETTNFYKYFKRNMRMTPEEFRSQY